MMGFLGARTSKDPHSEPGHSRDPEEPEHPMDPQEQETPGILIPQGPGDRRDPQEGRSQETQVSPVARKPQGS